MKLQRRLYRNAEARDNLEVFLVSAISSLLLLRFYLYLAGYPQVGGGSLHIAHMLYGGLLLMVAVVINISFLGSRAERLAAVVGGVGFGVFIDELGKFITKDNNYFFRPTIGIIYALFCVLYLTFNFLGRRQRLSSEEYQLNALRQFEEAVVHHMDKYEKSAMHEFLRRADKDSAITQGLKDLLQHVETIPVETGRAERVRKRLARSYGNFWRQRNSNRFVAAVFVLQAAVFIIIVANALFSNFDSFTDLFSTHDTYVHNLIIGQLLASLVAAVFVITAVVQLPGSRAEALEWFRRAILTNLFLTEFFIFCRIQFRAIPGFVINLILLGLLRYALTQERRAS